MRTRRPRACTGRRRSEAGSDDLGAGLLTRPSLEVAKQRVVCRVRPIDRGGQNAPSASKIIVIFHRYRSDTSSTIPVHHIRAIKRVHDLITAGVIGKKPTTGVRRTKSK